MRIILKKISFLILTRNLKTKNFCKSSWVNIVSEKKKTCVELAFKVLLRKYKSGQLFFILSDNGCFVKYQIYAFDIKGLIFPFLFYMRWFFQQCSFFSSVATNFEMKEILRYLFDTLVFYHRRVINNNYIITH